MTRTTSTTSSRSTTRRRSRSRGRRRGRCGARPTRSRSSNTPATRAITRWPESCAAREPRSVPRSDEETLIGDTSARIRRANRSCSQTRTGDGGTGCWSVAASPRCGGPRTSPDRSGRTPCRPASPPVTPEQHRSMTPTGHASPPSTRCSAGSGLRRWWSSIVLSRWVSRAVRPRD